MSLALADVATPVHPRRVGRWLLAVAVALVVAGAAGAARADDEALVRVIAEEAKVHTGPGFAFRTVYVASRGEVLPALARAPQEHWFHVRLPDGTYGWILGDEVFPLDVEASAAHEGPSFVSRISDALFSPAPWQDSRIGLAFSAGVIGSDSAFVFRPSYIFEPHVALEAFVAESVGNLVDVLYYGAGVNLLLFPRSPVTPFVSGAGGVASGRAKAGAVAVETGTYAMFDVGGGLLIALKKRLILRGDARTYLVFDPNHAQRVEEYSGALSVMF